MNDREKILEARIKELEECLLFYADPETYFAIGFFPDPPCGEFMTDFEEWPHGSPKPGKRARTLLNKLYNTK